MKYEAGGYPSNFDGVPPDVWRLAVAAGRHFKSVNFQTKQAQEYIYMESISQLEEQVRIAEASLAAARDPDVAISSANPNQYVSSPMGNALERLGLRNSLTQTLERLASRRTLIHRHVLRKHYELKFSGIADDVFTRIRDRVAATIGRLIPDAVQRLTAVYENLRSDNPEDWSNAVHSCRRILQDLADVVFPPRDEQRVKQVEGKTIQIKLGQENYINRIMAFVEDASSSERFQDLVGSHISFLGDRLDSILSAANKGSHDTIVSREEADRYVVYTYLLVGDTLSLYQTPANPL
jgi:hypothetical protein